MQMPEELKRITAGFRGTAGGVTDSEADEIFRLCLRKMEICGIENREEYLPFLFRDEVKNFIIRRGINAITALRRMGVAVSV